jgi:hypothetical protein
MAKAGLPTVARTEPEWPTLREARYGQPSPVKRAKVGGRRGARTRGLRIANAALSQLS